MQVVMANVDDYAGAVECDPATDPGCNDRGFMCPDLDPISCFGKKGLDIVESVGISYSAFTRDDHFARNLFILLGIGTFWRLLYLVSLVQKVHNSETPKPLPAGVLDSVRRPPPPPPPPKSVHDGGGDGGDGGGDSGAAPATKSSRDAASSRAASSSVSSCSERSVAEMCGSTVTNSSLWPSLCPSLCPNL